MPSYSVNFFWDAEAGVWVATSEDIPGLAMESGSYDALIERVRFAVPELLVLNGLQKSPMLAFSSYRQERVA